MSYFTVWQETQEVPSLNMIMFSCCDTSAIIDLTKIKALVIRHQQIHNACVFLMWWPTGMDNKSVQRNISSSLKGIFNKKNAYLGLKTVMGTLTNATKFCRN